MKRREKCGVEGKDIYATKAEVRQDLAAFRRGHSGRGKTYRCSFGDHYHLSKGLCGRKGKSVQ